MAYLWGKCHHHSQTDLLKSSMVINWCIGEDSQKECNALNCWCSKGHFLVKMFLGFFAQTSLSSTRNKLIHCFQLGLKLKEFMFTLHSWENSHWSEGHVSQLSICGLLFPKQPFYHRVSGHILRKLSGTNFSFWRLKPYRCVIFAQVNEKLLTSSHGRSWGSQQSFYSAHTGMWHLLQLSLHRLHTAWRGLVGEKVTG